MLEKFEKKTKNFRHSTTLKRQGWCFICLQRAGLLARKCNTKIQCLRCQARHHLAVCDGKDARASGNSDSAVDGASNQ